MAAHPPRPKAAKAAQPPSHIQPLPVLPRDIWTLVAMLLLPSSRLGVPSDTVDCVRWVFNLVCVCSELSQLGEVDLLWAKCEHAIRGHFVMLETALALGESRRERLLRLFSSRLRFAVREGAGRTVRGGLSVRTRQSGCFHADIALPEMAAGDEFQLLLYLSERDDQQYVHNFGIRAPYITTRELASEPSQNPARFASFLDDTVANGDPMDMLCLGGLIKITVRAQRPVCNGRRSARLGGATRLKCVAQRYKTSLDASGRPVLSPHTDWGAVEFGWLPASPPPLLWLYLFFKKAEAIIFPASHLEVMQGMYDEMHREGLLEDL